MTGFAQRLAGYLSAPYPLVVLRTHEEDRGLAILQQVAAALHRPVSVWRPEEHADPASSFLQQVATWREPPRRACLVALDAERFLADATTLRVLRANLGAMMAADATLVIVTPHGDVPDGLERDVVVLDVPLPSREELSAIGRRVLPTDGVDVERVATAALGLTAREALRAFRRAGHVASSARGAPVVWETAVLDEKRRLMDAGSALEFCESGVDLGGVGGLDELKRWVDERRRAFTDEARRFGLPQPRGLLLLGVQGCGKSLAAKSLAGYWGLPLLRLDIGALFDGDTPAEPALRRAALTAEAMAPCVLWVDEIEKGFPAGDGATTRLLGSLLTWLQEKRAPVFFVATANNVETLPPELLRRGRFDEVFFVDLPDLEARREILAIHLAARGRDAAAYDPLRVAQVTANYSGAELEQIVSAALYTAFASGRELGQADLEAAARMLVPLYALREVEIKALRTWARDRARPAGHDRSLLDLFDSPRSS